MAGNRNKVAYLQREDMHWSSSVDMLQSLWKNRYAMAIIARGDKRATRFFTGQRD